MKKHADILDKMGYFHMTMNMDDKKSLGHLRKRAHKILNNGTKPKVSLL